MENSYNWREFASLGGKQCFKVLRKLTLACFGCAFALCGAMIGTLSGAVKGQTTETGLSRGAVIGAVTGAIVGMEVLESCLQGELLSKVAILSSIANGKIFRELAGDALLKAYEWQVTNVTELFPYQVTKRRFSKSMDNVREYIRSTELSDGESSDIFDVTGNNGLLLETINKLSYFKIPYTEKPDSCRDQTTSCAVCLQGFKNGECVRKLPPCGHIFHVICIDRWLLRHGSCPICRQIVLANIS